MGDRCTRTGCKYDGPVVKFKFTEAEDDYVFACPEHKPEYEAYLEVCQATFKKLAVNGHTKLNVLP